MLLLDYRAIRSSCSLPSESTMIKAVYICLSMQIECNPKQLMHYFYDIQVDAEWSVMQQAYTCTQKGQIQHAVKPAAVRGWKINKHFTI